MPEISSCTNRFFTLHLCTMHDSQLIRVNWIAVMHRATIIPKNHVAELPNMRIFKAILSGMLPQKVKHLFTLFSAPSNYVLRRKHASAAEIKGRFFRNWMKSDQRMIRAGDLLQTSRRFKSCLLYTSPSPRDISGSRMPSSA